MQMRNKALSTIACIVMALLLIGGMVYVARATQRVVPDNPIRPPVERITLPEMLVAPDDSPGEAEGDFETTEPQEEPEQQQQQQQQQTPTATAAPATVAANENATSTGGGSGTGGGTGTGDGGEETPVPQGGVLVETNLPGSATTNPTIYTDDSRVSDDVLYFYIRLGSLANEGDRIVEVVAYETRIAPNGGTVNNRIDLPLSADGNYALPLKTSYSYTVTFKVRDANGNERTEVVDFQGNPVPSSPFTYNFTYMAKLADRSNPTVGAHPPTIETNLVDGQEVNAQNTLLVRAVDYKGNQIAPGDLYSGVLVTVDGVDWATYQAGKMGSSPTINRGSFDSYDLWFTPEFGRDYEEHEIEITAYDDEGNSRWTSYTVIYKHTAVGEKLGEITINVMAPTIGLGTILSISGVEFYQGEDMPDVIKRALEDQGYTAVFENDDYLAAINCGGMCAGAYIPDDLYEKMVEQDGITVGAIPYNGLHDLDITPGSGWLYSVDGQSPSTSLKAFHVQPGSTVNLIFMLAWGKDIGRTSTDGGALSSYCGSWMTGSYVPDHHFEIEEEIVSFEPDYATEEYCARVYAYKCSVCGAISGQAGAVQTYDYTIEYVDHEWQVLQRLVPTEDEDGFQDEKCTHCGIERRVVLPATGGGEGGD